MIEENLADRFRAALADEPPLGFDPDDVVDRAARIHRRRSAVFAASAATATVVLAAVTVLQVVRADDGLGGGVGSAPTSKPSETTPVPPCDPKPTETKPTETKPRPTKPRPTGTKPTEPKLTETKPIEPKPTGTRPKPTETKPVPPCETKLRDFGAIGPFTGAKEIISRLQELAPLLLAEHAPDLRFEEFAWKAYDERRCVAGMYQVAGTQHPAVTLTVCHEQGMGRDQAAAVGDWGLPLSDTTNADGSHLRVYRFDHANGANGLAVLHARTDGAIVQADTGLKPEGTSDLVVSQEQLTALATDGRLTF